MKLQKQYNTVKLGKCAAPLGAEGGIGSSLVVGLALGCTAAPPLAPSPPSCIESRKPSSHSFCTRMHRVRVCLMKWEARYLCWGVLKKHGSTVQLTTPTNHSRSSMLLGTRSLCCCSAAPSLSRGLVAGCTPPAGSQLALMQMPATGRARQGSCKVAGSGNGNGKGDSNCQ